MCSVHYWVSDSNICFILILFLLVHFFRYTSPTDLMVSPVTKGLLARSKKGGALLPPGKSQTKVTSNSLFCYNF